MMARYPSIVSIVLCLMGTSSALQTQIPRKAGRPIPQTVQQSRRDVFAKIGLAGLVMLPAPGQAEDETLTSQMFNEDGSLKQGIESEAKERAVKLAWSASEGLKMAVDGSNKADMNSGSEIQLSYNLPMKWSDGKNGDALYFDRSEGTNEKACKRITLYQSGGKASLSTLQKASTIGVAKALNVPDSLKRLYNADIISGRTVKKDDQLYYEYDMAAAPETCGDSKENLGLGFCPYDNIYLLSATVLDGQLYVACVECDSTRIWKLASAELKRVRSSFTVTAAAAS